MANKQWYVLKAGQEYVAVLSDTCPSPDVLTLEVEHDDKVVDVLTDFTVVYGPCDEVEARDYLNDMRGSDG